MYNIVTIAYLALAAVKLSSEFLIGNDNRQVQFTVIECSVLIP